MVVKSVSLVELKKQQWAKEKGKHFLFYSIVHTYTNVMYIIRVYIYLFICLTLALFYNKHFFFVLEELVKLNGYWRNQNTPIVFNDQKYLFCYT